MIDILSLTNIFGIFGTTANTPVSTSAIDNSCFDELPFDVFPGTNVIGPTLDISGTVLTTPQDDLSGSVIIYEDDLSGSVILLVKFDLSGTTITNL